MESQLSFELESIPLPQAVAELDQVKNLLEKKDFEFADSLINGTYGFKKRGFLTEKQTPFIYRLLQKAVTGPAKPGSAHVGSIIGLVQMFTKAKESLKYPSITLGWMGRKVRIKLTGEGSKFPGTISVEVDTLWFGRIHTDGTWNPASAFKHCDFKDELLDLLKALASHPSETSAHYGKLGGVCIYCMSALTDPKSLAMGYGPVCAKRWGLKWGGEKLTVEDLS
jgi:hypothetical protein